MEKMAINWKGTATIITAAMLVAFISGCATQPPSATGPSGGTSDSPQSQGTQPEQGQGAAPQEQGQSDSSKPLGKTGDATNQQPPVKTIDADVNADSKTGHDKNAETIALVVADGLYDGVVKYASPAGSETINIKLSIKNDIITAASVDGNTSSPISKSKVQALNGALPNLVVGKKITELNIPHNVAGSSLTTAAFKAYVDDVIAGKA